MGISAAIAATAGSVAGSIYAGNKQAKAQKKAGQQAAREAELNRRQQDREMNRLNQKTPNIAATLKRNKGAASGGVAGTYLTGTGGAPVSNTLLGRTTVLGS